MARARRKTATQIAASKRNLIKARQARSAKAKYDHLPPGTYLIGAKAKTRRNMGAVGTIAKAELKSTVRKVAPKPVGTTQSTRTTAGTYEKQLIAKLDKVIAKRNASKAWPVKENVSVAPKSLKGTKVRVKLPVRSTSAAKALAGPTIKFHPYTGKPYDLRNIKGHKEIPLIGRRKADAWLKANTIKKRAK